MVDLERAILQCPCWPGWPFAEAVECHPHGAHRCVAARQLAEQRSPGRCQLFRQVLNIVMCSTGMEDAT